MTTPVEPAPPLSLGGSLSDFPLADVLTFLNMGQKTGAIEVISGSTSNRIFLRDGEVIYATSRNPRFCLPGFLVARGLVSETNANRLAERARAEHRSYRDLVVETGLVSAEEMTNLEKILCGEIAFDAMRWKAGKFAFLKDRTPDGTTTKLLISVQNLILEGARRLDEAMRLEQEEHIDRELLVTLVCATGRLEQQVVLTPPEWGVISLINGKRSIDEIFAISPVGSEADTWAILQRLEAAHLIQIHTRSEAPEEEAAGEELTVLAPLGKGTEELRAVRSADEDRPTVPGLKPPPSIESSDIRLIAGDDVTTSHAYFGKRQPARLVSASDSGEAASAFDLDRTVLTVGRSPSNDIVLPHQSVSKQHAQILQDGDGWKIFDLNSTNGTRVNDEKVSEARLQPGDRIQIGAYVFEFDAVAAGLRA